MLVYQRVNANSGLNNPPPTRSTRSTRSVGPCFVLINLRVAHCFHFLSFLSFGIPLEFHWIPLVFIRCSLNFQGQWMRFINQGRSWLLIMGGIASWGVPFVSFSKCFFKGNLIRNRSFGKCFFWFFNDQSFFSVRIHWPFIFPFISIHVPSISIHFLSFSIHCFFTSN